MKRKVYLALVAFFLLTCAQCSLGDLTITSDTVFDGGNESYVYVREGASVEMTGGNIEALVLYDDSWVRKTGGEIGDFISAHDSSTLDILSPWNGFVTGNETATINLYSGGGPFYPSESSTFNMFGGIVQRLIVRDEATAHLYAGQFSIGASGRRLEALHSSEIHFYGTEFFFEPKPLSPTCDGFLSGIWGNGTSFKAMIHGGTYDKVTLHVVPEPTSVGILSFGALVMLRKRR